MEFSDTTLDDDDGRKKANDAKGGLQELWIIRSERQDVRVRRGPNPDGSWQHAALFLGDAVIAPLAAPALAIPVRALFED